ncbi:head-tail connector protein [Rhizobium sp. 768_B6_N1_8]|uniref:head-tail connector protein n=1 Tax=unclassified Rhizobium TaxID=2613769 RepID=UPI003F2450CF
MGNVVITQTGPLYTLGEVKMALHVDHSDDDVLIESYMDAAEQAVLQYCNISLVPLGKEATFKAAAMLVISQLYDNGLDCDSIPNGAKLLINPYRWLRV